MHSQAIPLTPLALLFTLFLSCAPANLTPSAATTGRNEQLRLLGEYDGRDKAKALELARELAGLGDPFAQAYLGARYLGGEGVEKSRERADALFEQASKNGPAEVDFLIGKTFVKCKCDGKTERVFAWFSRAAERGHPQANFDMGGVYELGYHVKADPKKAFAYFSRAAELGYVPAMMKVAGLYERGIGVKKSSVQAEVWRAKANSVAIGRALESARQ